MHPGPANIYRAFGDRQTAPTANLNTSTMLEILRDVGYWPLVKTILGV